MRYPIECSTPYNCKQCTAHYLQLTMYLLAELCNAFVYVAL